MRTFGGGVNFSKAARESAIYGGLNSIMPPFSVVYLLISTSTALGFPWSPSFGRDMMCWCKAFSRPSLAYLPLGVSIHQIPCRNRVLWNFLQLSHGISSVRLRFKLC